MTATSTTSTLAPPDIPAALLSRYDVPGPRYTSYPTVPHWESTPTSEEWISHLGRCLADGSDAAVYVHIPFCRSLCTYCGCNVRITRNRSLTVPYLDSVLTEWQLYRRALGIERLPVGELHLGGGTPTFLTPPELTHLIEGLLAGARLAADAELSIEVDPRVTSAEHLQALAALGFRRISLGVQDFDPRVQDIVNRVQSEEQIREVSDTARSLGFQSVNFDLIYGLPLQTEESIRSTMAAVGRLRPDRIALYSYAHVPWIKPQQRRFTEADLPVGDAKRALYECGRELLTGEGYREIGLDHFALPEDALWKASESGTLHRNFMGYTSRRSVPQLGLGVSAIGDAWSAFAQNEKVLERYEERVALGELPIVRGHVLTAEDLELRSRILELMTRFRTNWDERGSAGGFLRDIGTRLAPLASDGLIVVNEDACEVTDVGRAFLRNVCMAFDARLVRQRAGSAPAGAPVFSRTV
jgi:oxygen-independent coproporphyrinogen-3 oxidase